MIDYDSFSLCHLTDIFFRYSRGSKRVKLYDRDGEIILSSKLVERCNHSSMKKVSNDLLEAIFTPYPGKIYLFFN